MAEKVSFNAAEAWGLLDDRDYDKYDAVVGVRFCDNRSRNLATFANRQTVVGDKALTRKISKWLFSKRTMQAIKANTSFCLGLDGNTWVTRTAMGNDNDIQVLLRATCRGEYCYVGVYAKRVRNGRIFVLPDISEGGSPGWRVGIEGQYGDFPMVYADSANEAIEKVMSYIANELDGKECLE